MPELPPSPPLEPAKFTAASSGPGDPKTALDSDGPRDLVLSTFVALMDSGKLLDRASFLEHPGWNSETLDAAVLALRIFYIEVSGRQGYPAFYLDAKYSSRDLERITQLLGDLSGGSKWLFFTTPKASLSLPIPNSPTALARVGGSESWSTPLEDRDLGLSGVKRSPLQALEAGEFAWVEKAARAYAER
ncbi:MAG: hypothetical protein V4844_03460 [Pseudomonadota bacterium]